MLSAEQLERIIKRALSSGGDYADIFIEHVRPSSMVLEDGKIEKVSTGSIAGAGLRVLFGGGRTAYATTNELTEEALMELAASLSRAVSGGEAVSIKALRPASAKAPDVRQWPEEVPTEQKAALLRGADKAVRGASKHIQQVSAIYRDTVQEIQVAASTGEFATDKRIITTGIVQVVASDGKEVQTGYEPISGTCGFELFDEEALTVAAISAAGRATALLRARRAKGGRMPVIIASEAGGTMIHEAIGHGLEGDLSGQGLSRFSNKVGQKVASELVTVVDDPTLRGKRGSYAFDDEGVRTRRNVLVDKGVLRGYMHDRISAMRAGVEPTGNGRRESYTQRPIPRMSNTFIEPGQSDPAEVIRSADRGLLVKRMGGGQVNTVNGDFVFDVAEGYLIENGQQGDLVRGATLSGNGPEVLMAIDMVGNDLGFAIGTCGKDGQGVPVSDAMPTLRIPDIVVGGEA